MYTIFFIIVLIIGSLFTILLAINNHKKRTKKIQQIDLQCSEIVILANKISTNRGIHDLYCEDVLRIYEKKVVKVHSFDIDLNSIFLKSGYLSLSISNDCEEIASKRKSSYYSVISDKRPSIQYSVIKQPREYLAAI